MIYTIKKSEKKEQNYISKALVQNTEHRIPSIVEERKKEMEYLLLP